MRVKPSSRGCCWWFLVVTLALVYDAIVLYSPKGKLRNLKGLLLLQGLLVLLRRNMLLLSKKKLLCNSFDYLQDLERGFSSYRWKSSEIGSFKRHYFHGAILEYGGQMAEVKSVMDPAQEEQDSLKWITDLPYQCASWNEICGSTFKLVTLKLIHGLLGKT
ncbi:LOW QUALITY PROTEIN: hypothetical protein NC651_004744 [Populus alba x Populus x berolinensis]|nr:LOW QUALITY PROTEIN: hypothetical protein NC651_004744 [Populus alba x Populus x berolinensis]